MARRDWKDTVTVGADVALVGIAVTVCSLPVLTAGAAVHAGSVAVRDIIDGSAVRPSVLWRVFRRSLLPGAAATLATATAAWLLLFNLGAVASGRVPGGLPVLVGTGAVAAALLAACAFGVVHLAHHHSWPGALRWAAGAVWRQPLTAAMVAGVSSIAAVIGALIPVTAPLLVGYLLFAVHVIVARRFAADPATLETLDAA
ncbi:hypothetical protein AB0K00_16095 [Dactylosporangium sp. NPDC049525]|uniref:hypothetical protein n=1 Tax=Dactylosporangium sp. NPDC049525 TaxID=3154730 RepID=UPI0034214560